MDVLQMETSLKFLLRNCLDFEEDESQLQSWEPYMMKYMDGYGNLCSREVE
jgi:hypothetical protein